MSELLASLMPLIDPLVEHPVPARLARTTITLLSERLQAADRAIREGRALSRNELSAAALRRELRALERAAIDAAFAAMAEDEEAQREAERIAEEFADSDWEVLHIAEARL